MAVSRIGRSAAPFFHACEGEGWYAADEAGLPTDNEDIGDIAVLYVRGLKLAPLTFAGTAKTGDDAEQPWQDP